MKRADIMRVIFFFPTIVLSCIFIQVQAQKGKISDASSKHSQYVDLTIGENFEEPVQVPFTESNNDLVVDDENVFIFNNIMCLRTTDNHSLIEKVESIDELTLSDKIQSVTEDNLFSDPEYYNWCSSIIKGKDEKYHLVYSRWKRSYGFDAWLTHSEIAHAISNKPEGPYEYVNTLVNLERDKYKTGTMIAAHNPKIKYFDGRYYLYFSSSKMNREIDNEELKETAREGGKHKNWGILRPNQRTFVATSSQLDKGWEINKHPILEPSGPIRTIVNNPAIVQGPDKKYYLIVKGDKPGVTKSLRNQAIAISNYPDKEFVIQTKPVIEDWDTEDVSMWYNRSDKMFYAVFHAHTYIGMMVSENGIDWQKATDFTIMEKHIYRRDDQPDIIPDRMERPFVYQENDIPFVLSVAVKKGDDAYIVFLPLKH